MNGIKKNQERMHIFHCLLRYVRKEIKGNIKKLQIKNKNDEIVKHTLIKHQLKMRLSYTINNVFRKQNIS